MEKEEKQGILRLVCSGIKENYELAEQLCLGLGSSLPQLLEQEGYHSVGLRTLANFRHPELNLYAKKLEKIPDILPQSLTLLYLVHNLLQRIPEELPPLLKNISCNFNNINELPNTLPPNLLYFNCYNNQLKKLPEQLPDSLVRLDFSHNQITEPPAHCPSSLMVIKYEGNPLKSLGFIPDLFYFKEKNQEWWRKGWTYRKYQWVREDS